MVVVWKFNDALNSSLPYSAASNCFYPLISKLPLSAGVSSGFGEANPDVEVFSTIKSTPLG